MNVKDEPLKLKSVIKCKAQSPPKAGQLGLLFISQRQREEKI